MLVHPTVLLVLPTNYDHLSFVRPENQVVSVEPVVVCKALFGVYGRNVGNGPNRALVDSENHENLVSRHCNRVSVIRVDRYLINRLPNSGSYRVLALLQIVEHELRLVLVSHTSDEPRLLILRKTDFHELLHY